VPGYAEQSLSKGRAARGGTMQAAWDSVQQGLVREAARDDDAHDPTPRLADQAEDEHEHADESSRSPGRMTQRPSDDATTEDELYEVAGSRRPGLLADLTRARIVERKGDVFLLGSPALLAIAMKLESVGIDLETAAQASGILRKHLGRAVGELVELFLDRV